MKILRFSFGNLFTEPLLLEFFAISCNQAVFTQFKLQVKRKHQTHISQYQFISKENKDLHLLHPITSINLSSHFTGNKIPLRDTLQAGTIKRLLHENSEPGFLQRLCGKEDIYWCHVNTTTKHKSVLTFFDT